jgi:hypothetical protein
MLFSAAFLVLFGVLRPILDITANGIAIIALA